MLKIIPTEKKGPRSGGNEVVLNPVTHTHRFIYIYIYKHTHMNVHYVVTVQQEEKNFKFSQFLIRDELPNQNTLPKLLF